MTTILLKSSGGAIYEVYVVGAHHHPDGLNIRWGFCNYVLSFQINRLVWIDGGRIRKRYDWQANDLEECKKIFEELKEKKDE